MFHDPFRPRPPYMHPPMNHFQQGGYPQGPMPPQHMPKRRPGARIMQTFQTPEGNLDLQKMMTTVDTVVKTAHQVSPIIKSVGGYFIKK
ncbi:hypothetical protein FLK61_33425 [Paenalkalicoccus suaedae]|uniref:YppG-like protein n=1 Tax=Paenalkalicoccus suaedae TaxID=2592382 RepID=A0A859FFZ0_9BACI|nr:YppG family protein [Paenalkalicoccus suaedae]QKS71592.1 hypothetical protein FLK61_33425 [Paenalkalicoccus suaedae]